MMSNAKLICFQRTKYALAERGISQAELSRLSGTGPVAVSRFLRSERDVTTRVANRLLVALGLEIR